jgi:putative oxidoreductase
MVSPAARATEGTGEPDRMLRGALWAIQVALAGVFAWAGSTKIFRPGADLRASIPWMIDVPGPLIRVIGAFELLGAIGLVLPAATRIRPQLTPMAASCLTTVMTLAVTFHLYRGDTRGLVPAILGFAAALVAWGRFRKAPIAPR